MCLRCGFIEQPSIHTIAETPAYVGCKSWVELADPLDTAGSTAVLGDKDYQDVKWNLEMLLEPSGLA